MTEENVQENTAIKDAFNEAYDAGKDEDGIMIAMVNAGASFKGVRRLYEQLLVEIGVVDGKATKDAKVIAIMDAADVSTQAGYEATVADIMAQVKGITERAASSAVRAYCKKHEKAMWVAPKSEAGPGRPGFISRFCEWLTENPTATAEEAEDFIHGRNGHADTTPSIKKNSARFQKIRKMANAIAGVDVADSDDQEDEDDNDDEV